MAYSGYWHTQTHNTDTDR